MINFTPCFCVNEHSFEIALLLVQIVQKEGVKLQEFLLRVFTCNYFRQYITRRAAATTAAASGSEASDKEDKINRPQSFVN